MQKAIEILLVEDNPGDVVLTLEALEEGRVKNKVTVMENGQAAIDYLTKSSPYENTTTPDLVLLDINLPKIDGKEVLSFIKTSPKLKLLPVVMLTTSSSEKDVLDAYAANCNCYITKPADVNKFFEVIKAIEDFWVTIATLPGKS